MRFLNQLLPLLFLGLFQISYSQSNSQVEFKNKVNEYLEKIKKDAELSQYRTFCNKILLKGSFDNKGKVFRQAIKVYQSGMIKEHTKIYGKSMGMRFLIADITRINNRIFFAKVYETKSLGKQKYVRLSEETLFNDNIYNRKDLGNL